MPTYQYRCKSCAHEFEAFQSMLDDPLSTCPKCNQKNIFRIIQPVGVQFKGSGFYITDKESSTKKSTSE